MEARLDLFEDAEDTTKPVDTLIVTRVRQPILGCGDAILLKFQHSGEDAICLGYCSPDELRFAMMGIGILPLPARRPWLINDPLEGLQPYGR